jgi:hypothetical protein
MLLVHLVAILCFPLLHLTVVVVEAQAHLEQMVEVVAVGLVQILAQPKEMAVLEIHLAHRLHKVTMVALAHCRIQFLFLTVQAVVVALVLLARMAQQHKQGMVVLVLHPQLAVHL